MSVVTGSVLDMVKYKYTPEILEDAARRSHSIAGVMRILGIPPSGGNYMHIKRRMVHFGIDTSHFLGQGHNLGKVPSNRKCAAELLVALPVGSRRGDAKKLRRALLEVGVPYVCAICGLDGKWNGEPITLHVDHIDGNYLDCRQTNLRFLCPNCHSQTPNFAGKSKAKIREGGSEVSAA
jgi:hypothetical protein